MYLPKIQEMTLREQYATKFFVAFAPLFKAAREEGEDELEVSVREFDTFIVRHMLGTYDAIPDSGTAEWSKHVNERNSIRAQLNTAAAYGAHGEPPFRIDFEKGHYIVRLFTAMSRVTHEMVATQILSLAESKKKGLAKMQDYLHNNLHLLPPSLQAQVGTQDLAFRRALKQIAYTLNEFIDETDDLHTAAMSAIGAVETPQLIEHQ